MRTLSMRTQSADDLLDFLRPGSDVGGGHTPMTVVNDEGLPSEEGFPVCPTAPVAKLVLWDALFCKPSFL